MGAALPSNERTVLALLVEAAEGGAPCPKNEVLAQAVGAKSISTGACIVASLEALGLISVVRTRRTRVVTIAASGKSTAEVTLQRAPKHADELAERVAEGQNLAAAARAMNLSPTRVYQIWRWICDQLGPQAC